MLLSGGDNGVMIDVTGDHDVHAITCVVGIIILLDVLARDCLDVLRGTQDGVGHLGATIGSLVETLLDHLSHLRLNHLVLRKNARTLAVHSRSLEFGVGDHVTE